MWAVGKEICDPRGTDDTGGPDTNTTPPKTASPCRPPGRCHRFRQHAFSSPHPWRNRGRPRRSACPPVEPIPGRFLR